MKTPPCILRIAIPTPLRRSFDYLPPEEMNVSQLVPGVRVLVPFGKKETVGILLEVAAKSAIDPARLRQAISIIDHTPLLSTSMMELVNWASRYYQHPIGDVVFTALPKNLRRGKPIKTVNSVDEKCSLKPDSLPELSEHQKQAVERILAHNGFQTYLLDGVTGSGKTEVYLRVIDAVLAVQKQALVLVPEIGLTPQTVSRFQQRFNTPMAVLHSGLTDRERLNAWAKAREGDARIIIGTRSAVFTPMLTPGVVIIDEEHDASFKQQSGFRYSARDLAIMRARMENMPIVLGSATPSLETLENAQKKRFIYLNLPDRVGHAAQPAFQLVDLRNQKMEEGLSLTLLKAIGEHLLQGNQILLFLNRRGYAPVLLCHGCGWSAKCKRCDARLTLHQEALQLICHHCNAIHAIPKQCPQCQKEPLLMLGYGTERLEKALKKHFPTIAIQRIDRDTTRSKGAMDKILEEIVDGQHRILIGTQMLAKGHHFPNVTLVGIIDVDSGLYSTDFRAMERMAQLIMQVAGRAGRAEKPGQVYLQTHNPNHVLLQFLIRHGYFAFAKKLLHERLCAKWPPYSSIALIRADADNEILPSQFLREIREKIENSAELKRFEIQLSGPIPAPMERKAGRYRALLLLQTTRRSFLQNGLNIVMEQIGALKSAKKVHWSLDVDPLEMF